MTAFDHNRDAPEDQDREVPYHYILDLHLASGAIVQTGDYGDSIEVRFLLSTAHTDLHLPRSLAEQLACDLADALSGQYVPGPTRLLAGDDSDGNVE